MTTVDPGYNPEKYARLPEEQAGLLTPEFKQTAQQAADTLLHLVFEGGVSGQAVYPIVQPDARGDQAEAERDELVRVLSQRWKIDLEDRLNQQEVAHQQANQGLVQLDPWMQKAFNIQGAGEEGPIWTTGVRRWAKIIRLMEQEFWFHEVEVEGTYDAGTTDERAGHSRLMFFLATDKKYE